MAGVFAFPALLPRFLQEWGLTNTEAGWINGIYYAGYTVTVPVLASLTDRIDARRVYLASAAVAALAALGFALFANGLWTACLFRALGGLGLAGTFIPGLKVLVDRLHGTAQARAVAIYTATFGIGTSLSFFGAGELGARFGWRWAFVFAAASAVAALALIGTTVRPKSLNPARHSTPVSWISGLSYVIERPCLMFWLIQHICGNFSPCVRGWYHSSLSA